MSRTLSRKWQLAIGVLLVVVSAAAFAAGAGLDLPPKGSLYHGVFPGKVNDITSPVKSEDVLAYEALAGKTVAWAYFNDEWWQNRSFPSGTAAWIRASGRVPFVRLNLRSGMDFFTPQKPEPLYTLENVIRGRFDPDLRAWARAARDFGSPLIVEYGTEVNSTGDPWDGWVNGACTRDGYGDPTKFDGPERFQNAYRHIVQLFRDEQANNVIWALHFSGEDIYPDTPPAGCEAVQWNKMEYYYPGDEWVDWIGVSIYGSTDPNPQHVPFATTMDAAHKRLRALAPTKPLFIFEFGTSKGNDPAAQAAWARAALTDLLAQRWDQVYGFAWWNESWPFGAGSVVDVQMRLQDNPLLAEVFASIVGTDARVLGTPIFAPPHHPRLRRHLSR